MTSSMITGEQRWASKRRGGMTVLGKVAKVAVPKPLNLPSQRLENHGVDPTVEIVPKGTLSWGSRPSSASSNAWATSAPSPSTDVNSSSPSHLAGRPLSGSGTRPLTAGSEKSHDSNVSSRPSSASGVLGSNHASLASLRPHSAETRPGSSQLSRFAEPSPEGSRAWGATASSERMGASEGFSLSSGDFPTLGSEKDESRRNLESLDSSHGRPGSSSGGVKSISDSMEITHDDTRDTHIKGHSWRNDRLPFVEDGPRPSMDRWHGDPHLFQNPNIGPPHYDNWRGDPQANPQGGVWYRGPPVPPPYGGPIPSGPPSYGGPIPSGPPPYGSPFPYYRPQVAAPILANSQSTPPPGTGHHGHHPKNGEMYRPHMPESFMHPGVPMRPGFFPPPAPYEGYYRPPMGFCNPNDRDFAFMGMNSGPPIYNRPINQNAPDLNSSHGRGPDDNDPGLLPHPRGNLNVSANPNDGWKRNDEEKWGRRVTTDRSNYEKGILPKVTLQESAWGDNCNSSKKINYGESTAKDEVPHYSKFSGTISNVEESGRGSATDDVVSVRDHLLIQKIQGLNAKARTSGGSHGAFHREERTEMSQVDNVTSHKSIVDEGGTGVILERHFPTGADVASEKKGESVMIAAPRRPIHGTQNRGNHHVKGNFDGQDSSGWGRNSQSHSVRSASYNLTVNDQVEDHNSAVQPSEARASNIEMKGDGESTMPGFDRTDTQRAKMRELAKQRAIQLQKEEEERIREQKEKALAKLEELNRRTAIQGAEVPTQKEIVPPQSTTPLKPDDSVGQPDLEPKSTAGSSSIIPNKVDLIDKSGANKVQSPAEAEDAVVNTMVPQVCDVSKNKRAGYNPKQGVPLDKNLSQMSIIVGQIDVLKDHKLENVNQDVKVVSKVVGAVGQELPEKPLVSDLSTPHKRRNNKSGKNKHKVEDSPISVSSTVSLNKLDLGQAVSESGEDKAARCFNTHTNSTLQGEDVHGRVNNSWKGQYSRKPRSSHGNRLLEKAQSNDAVVWAPVRSHSKVENTDRANEKASELFVSLAVGENRPQSSSKTKRAEMERYVPKPVAKELAQQGSVQQPLSVSVDHSPIAQPSPNSSSGIVGRDKVSQGSDSGASSVMKDQLPSGRGKSQPYKGKKGSGNNGQSYDPKISNASLMDSHCDTEIIHREKTQPSKENRAVVDRSTPHWQPKSQVNAAHNQQGNRTHGGQDRMAQDNQGLKPDIASGSGAHSQSQDSQHNQSAAKNPRLGFDVKAMQDVGHQETKREKRGPHFKGRPHTSSQEKTSASQGVEVKMEPVSSEGADRRNEQRPSSGYRKNSTLGGRFSRVHDTRGDWSTVAPESRHHYSSGNATERQRQNSHYEYQPVRPYNSNESGPQVENQHGGPNFRERGHSRRGRGNFHGRQTGNNE